MPSKAPTQMSTSVVNTTRPTVHCRSHCSISKCKPMAKRLLRKNLSNAGIVLKVVSRMIPNSSSPEETICRSKETSLEWIRLSALDGSVKNATTAKAVIKIMKKKLTSVTTKPRKRDQIC